jgi:hypothetical protein
MIVVPLGVPVDSVPRIVFDPTANGVFAATLKRFLDVPHGCLIAHVVPLESGLPGGILGLLTSCHASTIVDERRDR